MIGRGWLMAVVIVGDESTVRRFARRLLEAAGLSVVGEASNGGEALAMVEVLKPAVVLMDGRMPLMDGVTATRYLKALHPAVKVIAHSADTSISGDLMVAGAVAVVVKGSDDLVPTVRSALGGVSGHTLSTGLKKL